MSVEIVQADTRNLPVDTDAVDLIVTSPPYWSLRAYEDNGTKYAGQIGAEPTPAAYVDALIECTREWLRVLKPAGSLWVNLGDKYGPKKTLIGLPWRYALRCIDELGLILRAEVIWRKTNGLPEKVSDRVRRDHETWFHFVQQPKYFSSLDPLRVPVKARRAAMTYEQRKAAGESGRRGEQGRNDVTVDGMTPHALGRVPGSVWDIATRALRVPSELSTNHYAAFPVVWPKRLITGWSPESGTVLDPFGGTGTTALAADILGRHGISVDMSSDYCEIARWRTTDPDERRRAIQAV